MTLSIRFRSMTAWVILILIVVLFPSAVKSQTLPYIDNDADYILELPSPKWRTVTLSGIARTSTEFRYGDEGLVQLRIRKELVDAGVSPVDMVQRQQRFDRGFLVGYVKGKVESFEGQLNGTRYPYEYVSAGKPMAGLSYYLQANNRVVYRIEFTGPADELRILTDQTEFIAQSFRLR
ncbi:MAG TPA: hypothetical protein VLB68_12390 [Pyrinomonadaceae bacterium]|nr:hypothetical protein [Pyrinomonadaceae bacterium]